jgi:hypothetical protein
MMPYDAVKALAFATGQSGRYRDGECWTLMEDAVVGNGGTSSKKLTPNFSASASFVWGDAVAIANLKPGDVLQFQGYDWQRHVRTEVTMPPNYDRNGSDTTMDYQQTRGEPQHSAMVVSVVSAGIVNVVEQNIPPILGDVQTYQLVLIPRPKSEVTTRETITYTDAGDPEKKKISGDIVTKVTITETVSHPPRCYRPK